MIRRCAAVALFLLGPASALAQAPPDDPTVVEARQRFDRGVEFYRQGDFQAAYAEFERAYRLRPHPSVLVNLANCALRTGRSLEAARHFEQFLRESPDVSADQRHEVEGALARARAGLASLTFLLSPSGATVTLDREPLGPVEDGTHRTVAPGRHLVRVVHPGYLSAERIVRVTAGQRAEVVVDLLREDVAHGRLEVAVAGSQGEPVLLDGRPVGETPWAADVPVGRHDLVVRTERGDYRGPVDVRRARRVEIQVHVPPAVTDDRQPYHLLGGAVTGGLLVGAAVTGLLALSFENGFEESALRIERDQYDDDAELEDLRLSGRSAADTADVLAVVSDVMWVGGFALGAATVGYFLLAEPVQEAPRADIRLAASPGARWLGLAGRF